MDHRRPVEQVSRVGSGCEVYASGSGDMGLSGKGIETSNQETHFTAIW